MKIYLIIPFLLFANILLGQYDLQVEKSVEETEKQNISKNNNNTPPSLQSIFSTESDFLLKKPASYFSIKKNKPSKMPFFCDVEAKMEKASKLPVRFRLGDAQTVDRKEGKWQQFQPLPHISN